MKPELGKDWRGIIKYAWSMRLMAIAAMLSGFEVALALIPDAGFVQPGVLAAVSGVVTMGAFVARLLVQKDL